MIRLRHPISLLLICLMILLGVLRSFSAPEPRGADSPDVIFSAKRAEVFLTDLLSEGVPHVAGSAENRRVRDRVIGHLEDFGYEPEVQSLFHCNPAAGACSPVENIIAVKAGSTGKNAVLLTAHYDGSWTGPGAADDGAGVAAILEIARMDAEFPPYENDIIFLFSDSEENGLIGADAFAKYHPLFDKVKAVINLEARGASGASAMFETGEGNRRIIRSLAKAIERPVANSLTYEIYKRMPNDTDYSVYKGRDVLGVNFAFSSGVAVYHSVIDNPEHLDLGSLQHHGDNAWGMLNALGDRNLTGLQSREDAGYIDVFAAHLVHYPASIALGMALLLGVATLIVISLTYRREIHFAPLGWGILALPFLLICLVLGGFLLSYPLGHWADIHPIEHPQPWVGRIALFLMTLMSLFVVVKVFRTRISPCAMMLVSWSVVFVLAMVLANILPTASHLALIPLTLFLGGSLVDLLRRKSNGPLLIAAVMGFAGAAFISFYHFFMLEVVLNFDQSHIRIAPLILLAATSLPLLLAWVGDRDLSWEPARWLLVAIAVACFIHLSLPAYTPERPRDMALMYNETEGGSAGQLVLESIYQRPDEAYVEAHGFQSAEVDSGWPQKRQRPVIEVTPLNLPGLVLNMQSFQQDDETWRRRFSLQVPRGIPMVQLVIPPEFKLQKAWVNGKLALDKGIETKYSRSADRLRIVNSGTESLEFELLLGTSDPVTFAAVTWHPLPDDLVAPYMDSWPDDAQPFLFGPRAQKVQRFTLAAGSAANSSETGE